MSWDVGIFYAPYVPMDFLEHAMDMKIINLDRRFNGHADFKYRAVFARTVDYCNAREWCWETFGPACELEARSARPGGNWCFDMTANPTRRYIYLRGDEQLALFKLKWS
jgi:hypothetical protein